MKQWFLINTWSVWILIICGLGACEAPKTPPSQSSKGNDVEIETKTKDKRKLIVFFGNSLTAAYGLERDEGFTSLIQEKIDELQKPYQTVNAGNSGETTAGGLNRIDWILERNVMDIFVLELGGNDGLRGVNPESSYQNLKQIVEKVRNKYPDCRIVLAGMQAPPNMGADYTEAFKNIFPKLAKELSLELIPFLLEGVAGIPELNQSDRIHPTADGHMILTENIWKILEPML